jgi:hypothetical protein
VIHNWKFQIPTTKSQGISKLQHPKQVARLMFGAWFIEVSWSLDFGI